MKIKYCIDMDGVIAEWGTEGYTEKGYFSTRPAIPNMVLAVAQMVKQGKDVYILSSVLQDDHSATEKHIWLDIMFGDLIPMEHRIFVPYGDCKDNYVEKIDGCVNVLIDDYNPNLEAWSGIAIKFLNGMNGASKQWTGNTVHYLMPPAEIVSRMNNICCMC